MIAVLKYIQKYVKGQTITSCSEKSNVIVKENALRMKGFVFSHRLTTQEDVIGFCC